MSYPIGLGIAVLGFMLLLLISTGILMLPTRWTFDTAILVAYVVLLFFAAIGNRSRDS